MILLLGQVKNIIVNPLKSLVFLALLSLSLTGFCQEYRERSGLDERYNNIEILGHSKHRSIDHEKWKKTAKKKGASYYAYNTGTTSYRTGVNSTLNTGDIRYYVVYYNLTPKTAEQIQQIEAHLKQQEMERQREKEKREAESLRRYLEHQRETRITETGDSVTVQDYVDGELSRVQVYANDDFFKQNDWKKFPISTVKGTAHNSLRSLIMYLPNVTTHSTWENGRMLDNTQYSKENPEIKTLWVKYLPDGSSEWESYYDNGKVESQSKKDRYGQTTSYRRYDENGNREN